MINFLRSLLPGNTPPSIAHKGMLAVIRERILQSFFLGFAGLGLFMIIPTAVRAFMVGHIALGIFYITAYSWVVLLAMFRDWNYNLRAATLSLLTYVVAWSELFDSGMLGEVRYWLLVFVILPSVLMAVREAFIVNGFSFLTILSIGFALENHLFTIPNYGNFFRGTSWILSAIISLAVGSSISIAISALISSLGRTLVTQEETNAALEIERQSLENRVNTRTVDLQRRLVQARASADISRAISRLSDPDTIFMQVSNLILERFGLYYVGIFLLDPEGENAVLHAGTGEAGKTMQQNKHHLPLNGSSMIGWCIINGKARIALDVGQDAIRFNNPNLPKTRSEVAIPIMSRGQGVGAITLQSDQPSAFDQDDLVILQGVADSLSIAVENDRLFSLLSQNLEEVRSLNRNYLRQAWSDVMSQYGSLSSTYETDNAAASAATSTISLPIILRDQIIGQISLDVAENQLSQDDLTLLDAITTQTALALENARLLEETERRAVQEQKLSEMSNRFSRSFDIESILKAAAEELGQLPAVSEVSVQLVTADIFSQVGVQRPAGNGKG